MNNRLLIFIKFTVVGDIVTLPNHEKVTHKWKSTIVGFSQSVIEMK